MNGFWFKQNMSWVYIPVYSTFLQVSSSANTHPNKIGRNRIFENFSLAATVFVSKIVRQKSNWRKTNEYLHVALILALLMCIYRWKINCSSTYIWRVLFCFNFQGRWNDVPIISQEANISTFWIFFIRTFGGQCVV